jgi:hypothetical protein
MDPIALPIEKEMESSMQERGLRKLAGSSLWVVVAAFGTYFCMYGFRKPYTAATWAPFVFWGFDYKFLMVIAQTTGYVLSKWLGIKIVSEVKPHQRTKLLFLLIAFSEVMLLLFAWIPKPWNIICMFLNGLPLGIVFGLVLGFLEGRKKTELLVAGVCASFIVADGVCKSAGTYLLALGISEKWMPFSAGLIFLLPLALFLGMLNQVPPPSAADIANRSARAPMFHQQRKDFFLKYTPGLIGITIVYLLVTLLRSIRADFAPELWASLGYIGDSSVFTQTELIVSAGVLLFSAFTFLIADHRKAMRFALLISLAGFIIMLFAVAGFLHGLPGYLFVVLTGLGVYLPYVSIHTTIFERMIAITRERANIGFLMYIVDSVGYTGYIILMLFSAAFPPLDSILPNFIRIDILLAVSGVLMTLYCFYYFNRKLANHE